MPKKGEKKPQSVRNSGSALLELNVPLCSRLDRKPLVSWQDTRFSFWRHHRWYSPLPELRPPPSPLTSDHADAAAEKLIIRWWSCARRPNKPWGHDGWGRRCCLRLSRDRAFTFFSFFFCSLMKRNKEEQRMNTQRIMKAIISSCQSRWMSGRWWWGGLIQN